MDVLNKIVRQNFEGQLSDRNVLDIVNHYKILNDLVDKARYTRTIMECFNNDIIDPDTFLIAAIMSYETPSEFPLIALSLRYGADSKYVTYKDVGNVHIMVFTVMELMGKANVSNFEIENILCIMALLGISTAARAFTVNTRDDITVANWLEQNGFNNFLDPLEFLNMIADPDYNVRISIGAMCDIPEVAFPIGFDKTIITEYYDETGFLTTEKKTLVPQPSLPEMILYNSYDCTDKSSIQASFSTAELTELKMCIDTGALEIFRILIDRGFNFSYFSMNRLLSGLTQTNGDKIFCLIYIEMLKYVIARGITMDKFQFNFLNNFSTEYAREIEELYSTPLWQKACSGSDNIPLPTMVNALAASLNIDPSKDKAEVCSDLRSLASIDFNKLSGMELERQREQLRLSQPVTSRMNKKNTVFCKNASDIDPLRYTDNTLMFYTDKNSDSWCFSAGDFEELIRNPVNPITKEPLPPKVISHMADKMNLFQLVGINPGSLKTYDESLKELYKKDTISNIRTSEAIGIVINLGTTRGITEARFKSVPYSKMIYVLDTINLSQDYFGTLPRDYQFAVFCKLLYYHFKKYPDTLDDILEIIKY